MVPSPTRLELRPSGLAVITLDSQATLNAIGRDMARSLLRHVDQIVDSPDVRAVLLRAGGRSFGVGGDIHSFKSGAPDAAHRTDETLTTIGLCIERLRRFPRPVVAAVHGTVAGGSLGLMLCADYVIAHETSRFTTAYARIGASPDAGTTHFLTRLLGERRALEIFMFSEMLTAQQALQLGFVNVLVSDDDFDAAYESILARILEGPVEAWGVTKGLVYKAAGNTLERQMEEEKAAFLKAMSSQEFAAGVSAFLSKRQPEFRPISPSTTI